MGQASALWQEFKGFALKGNMIDLAVAVVIGGAFGAVVNSLVKNIIMPVVSYVTPGKGAIWLGSSGGSRSGPSSATS